MNAAEKARIAREEAEKEKEEKALNETKQIEVEKIKSTVKTFFLKKKWKIVTYGSYYTETTKKPIEWLVYGITGNEITLVSKYILDCHEFNEPICTSWEDSSIRSFLNSEFLKNAFNEYEQELLFAKSIDSSFGEASEGKYVTTKDKVYLLSSKDFSDKKQGKGFARLFSKTAKSILLDCKPTKYAISKELYKNKKKSKYYCWWLRDMKSQKRKKEEELASNVRYVVNFGTEYISCKGVCYAGEKISVAIHESNVVKKNGTRLPYKDGRKYKSFGVRPVITLKIED